MSEASLYVMESCGFVKIGISRDAHHRRINLQIGNPYPIKLVIDWDVALDGYDAREVEAELHRRLAAKRVRGEWFSATVEDIDTAMRATLMSQRASAARNSEQRKD